MKNLFGSLFSAGKPASNQNAVNSYEDLQVFENLNQQDEPLNWNDVPDLGCYHIISLLQHRYS